MKRIKTAIVGASGYTGMELLRLLVNHPGVELVAATSRQEAGKSLGTVFPRFRGAAGADLTFIEPDPDAIAATGAEAAFLALPHGVAADIARALLDRGLRVIDLSADFRLSDPAVYQEFYEHAHPAPDLLEQAVYGLPEVRAEEISAANLIASPGCYPTSIILPLLPLLLCLGMLPARAEQLFVAAPLTAKHSFTAGIEGPAVDAAGNVYAVNYGRQGTVGLRMEF